MRALLFAPVNSEPHPSGNDAPLAQDVDAEADALMERSALFRSQNSRVRLGNVTRTGANTGMNKNLVRARETVTASILEKKQKARDAFKSPANSVLVKVNVHLYMWPFNGIATKKNKMEKVRRHILLYISRITYLLLITFAFPTYQVADVQHCASFPLESSTAEAFDSLLAAVNKSHERKYETALPLNW